MVAFPHCKINLGLQVLSKRQDGYHNIETCFYPVPRLDALEIIKSDVLSFNQTGIPIPGASGDNLCVRAYQLLKQDFELLPVKIHLHKVIPFGAGLGGGSSDAAFTLLLLNDIFALNLKLEDLTKYAAQLGSDCSFFLQKNAKFGAGRGEVLHNCDLSLSAYWICMLKPNVHVSTAEAYAGIVPQGAVRSLKEILQFPVDLWKDLLSNDFEKSIFQKFPLIKELKEKLYSSGAVYAAMSGSGSTVFGLFSKQPSLQKAFEGIDYWEGELK